MRRIAVRALVFGALLYGVHRLAMVAVAWLIGNDEMIVGLDCCIDYNRHTQDPWGNVLVAVSGVAATQVVAWTAIGLLAARRGDARLLATLAATAYVVSPVLQLIVYVVWHWAERDYVAVIDYLWVATALPEQALVAGMVFLFAGYAVVFWWAWWQAWDRARPRTAPVGPTA
ncbi:hypothetical protein [Nonomuraea candida]|uniref:hypothetical protein n=1 Tax=Nonomuraea candida TaxID=359159 RepID=UPI0012FA6BB3|nr:hypothetical protein [Nonomuraea candida]